MAVDGVSRGRMNGPWLKVEGVALVDACGRGAPLLNADRSHPDVTCPEQRKGAIQYDWTRTAVPVAPFIYKGIDVRMTFARAPCEDKW